MILLSSDLQIQMVMATISKNVFSTIYDET